MFPKFQTLQFLYKSKYWNFRRPRSTSCSNQKTRQLSRILFLGNDGFSLESLRILLELFPKSSLTIVVSNETNVIGKVSKKQNLDLINWQDFQQKLLTKSWKYDVGVVASFGHLIPEFVIDSCSSGILNVHGSLLPKYRGAAPTAAAIMNNDSYTGISIMKIAPKKFDTGPILYQEKVPIHPYIRNPELIQYLAQIGSKALKKVIMDLDNYTALSTTQENLTDKPSFAPKLIPQMGIIDWDTKNAQEIYNLYRGLYGFTKLKTYYQDKLIDLDSFALVSSQTQNHDHEFSQDFHIQDFRFSYNEPVIVNIPELNQSKFYSQKPGTLYLFTSGSDQGDFLCVKCQKDWIGLRKIKVKAKWMSPNDFYNGYLSKLSSNQNFMSKI